MPVLQQAACCNARASSQGETLQIGKQGNGPLGSYRSRRGIPSTDASRARPLNRSHGCWPPNTDPCYTFYSWG